MKKLVLASAMALASVALVAAPALRAQDHRSDHDPEPRQNSMPTKQPSPRPIRQPKLRPWKIFYRSTPERGQEGRSRPADRHLRAAEPARQGAERGQPLAAGRSQQLQGHLRNCLLQEARVPAEHRCRNRRQQGSADLRRRCGTGQKGLTMPKPAGVSDEDWKKMTDASYPIFHSAIALDDAVVKKDMRPPSRSTPRN